MKNTEQKNWEKEFESLMIGFVPQDLETGHLQKRIKFFIRQALQDQCKEVEKRIEKSIKGQPCKEECQILKDRILQSLTQPKGD